jgi:ABC-type transport system involved in cytochrome c biogenesis ATPase subunit
MSLRVRSFAVEGLFGLYDHRVNLVMKERVTIVHGPNGVGKTVLLKMLHALFSQDYTYLFAASFNRVLVELDDGTNISLLRGSGLTANGSQAPVLIFEVFSSRGSIDTYRIAPENIDYEAWAREFERNSPIIYQSGPSRWTNSFNEVYYTAQELYQRFRSEAPEIMSPMAGVMVEVPSAFAEIYSNVNTFFIEAQRLIRQAHGVSRDPRRPRKDDGMVATAIHNAQDLARQFNQTYVKYSRAVQERDQTFPQRLFAGTAKLSPDELKKGIEDLEAEFNRLNSLGLLDSFNPMQAFNAAKLDTLESETLDAMSLYVADSHAKLKVLSEFADQVEPLIKSINQRFTNKQVKLDREKGLVAVSVTGDNIRVDQLSSGEQHELVLLYDLWFKVAANTLVLIDEPELSLHIDWQRQFLPDLIRIANSTGFDALVATHSPSIVGDEHQLLIGLNSTVNPKYAQ